MFYKQFNRGLENSVQSTTQKKANCNYMLEKEQVKGKML